jgi:hypothetical protein
MGQAVNPPIPVTCSKWYIRKALFVLGAQPLDESTELLRACLINLLLESFGALSVSATALLQHFWGPTWNLEGGVCTSCHWLNIPSLLGGLPLPGVTWEPLSQ